MKTVIVIYKVYSGKKSKQQRDITVCTCLGRSSRMCRQWSSCALKLQCVVGAQKLWLLLLLYSISNNGRGTGAKKDSLAEEGREG